MPMLGDAYSIRGLPVAEGTPTDDSLLIVDNGELEWLAPGDPGDVLQISQGGAVAYGPIDGDTITIDGTPSVYTPNVTAPALDAKDLWAHLLGIDDELGWLWDFVEQHDHDGVQGVQLAHSSLSGIGTNTHAEIDTALTNSANHIAASSPHSGHATLSGGKVVEDPANATATPTADKIPIADSSGKLDGWLSDASASTKGKIQLTADLGGTATAPKVVAITDSGATSHPITSITASQYLYVDASGNITTAAGSGGPGPGTTVQSETTWGISPAVGTSSDYARADHTHGTPAEPSGGGASSTTTGTAGETLAQYDIVYSDEADSGEFKKAQNDGTEIEADCIGIVTESGGISSGSTGEITLYGIITNAGWSWTPGATLWVGGTAGQMVDEKPASPNYFKPIGFAITATKILFFPQIGWPAPNVEEIPDIMGGRIERVSDTQIKWAFYNSNQARLWNNTASKWDLVSMASNPTLNSSANDIGGTAITDGRCYDIFLKRVSDTSASLHAARWTTGTGARYWTWITSAVWKVGDRVTQSGNFYLCIQEHTSGTFADDLAAGKWQQVTGGNALGMKDGVLTLGDSGVWAEYRYVGVVYLLNSGGPIFVQSNSQKLIANYYNTKPMKIWLTVNGGGATFTNTTYELWSNWTSGSLCCVIAHDQSGCICTHPYVGNNSSGYTYAGIFKNSTIVADVTHVAPAAGYNPTNFYGSATTWYGGPGYHKFDLYRRVQAGTATNNYGTVEITVMQ